MFEDLFNAFSNFRRNKTRTILSLLGIIIGVASVIVITTLGKSSSDSVRASFGSIGLDIISIMNNGPKHIRARLLSYNEAFREKLYALPYVQNVFFTNTFPATITRGNITVSMEALCTEYGYSNAQEFLDAVDESQFYLSLLV